MASTIMYPIPFDKMTDLEKSFAMGLGDTPPPPRRPGWPPMKWDQPPATAAEAKSAKGFDRPLETKVTPQVFQELAKTMPAAVLQAAQIKPAETPAGSVLGAGFGTAATGTGPLPGDLGSYAARAFGTNRVPFWGKDPALRIVIEAHGPFIRHIDELGRALARKYLRLRPPQLMATRDAIRSLQNIQDEALFNANLMAMIRQLANTIYGIPSQYTPGGAVVSPAPSMPGLPPIVVPAVPMFKSTQSALPITPTVVAATTPRLGVPAAPIVTPIGQQQQAVTNYAQEIGKMFSGGMFGR